MMSRNFRDMLEERWSYGHFVCVGLDSDLMKIPKHLMDTHDHGINIVKTMTAFNREIVNATYDLVASYKPNIAFFEEYGPEGLEALVQIVKYIRLVAPDVPVILDAKRADIGNTNRGYAAFAFDYLKAHAITVHPYLGKEALQPFLDRKEKGVFVLCRTSNPGASEFQDLMVRNPFEPLDRLHPEDTTLEPLYLKVARNVSSKWNENGNCGLVVGATYPQQLALVRGVVGSMPILIPGAGAQGGDLEASVRAGRYGLKGIIVNSSRGIIFASSGEDFAEAARHETRQLRSEILLHM